MIRSNLWLSQAYFNTPVDTRYSGDRQTYHRHDPSINASLFAEDGALVTGDMLQYVSMLLKVLAAELVATGGLRLDFARVEQIGKM